MKIRDIKKARLEHRSVYCIDKDTSDVLRCSVGLFGTSNKLIDVAFSKIFLKIIRNFFFRLVLLCVI